MLQSENSKYCHFRLYDKNLFKKIDNILWFKVVLKVLDLQIKSFPLVAPVRRINRKRLHLPEQVASLFLYISEAFFLPWEQTLVELLYLFVLRLYFYSGIFYESLNFSLQLYWIVLCGLYCEEEPKDSPRLSPWGRHIVATLFLVSQLIIKLIVQYLLKHLQIDRSLNYYKK